MTSIVDQLQALLFVTEGPVSETRLAEALGVTEGQAIQALEVLEARLESQGPLQVVRLAEGFQLATKPAFGPIVERFLKPAPRKITKACLEVLAVIAYRQPMTLAEVEAVRGVQCDHGVRTLMEKGLINEVGRKACPGRPILYATTQEFLHQFGLHSLRDLPSLPGELVQLPLEMAEAS